MTTSNPITNDPTSARRPNAPVAYTAEGTQPARVATRGSETKASFKTTEFMVYVVAVIGVLLASFLVSTTDAHEDYFRADRAWFYVVLLTIGYMVSRGLAKSVAATTTTHNPSIDPAVVEKQREDTRGEGVSFHRLSCPRHCCLAVAGASPCPLLTTSKAACKADGYDWVSVPYTIG